jgi:TusA-related sulfurtransferase
LERVKRAYARLAPGARLEVRSPIAEHAFAVRAWARKNDVAIVGEAVHDGVTALTIEARHPAA